MSENSSDSDLSELKLILFKQYGYDFSEYSKASFKRRTNSFLINYKIANYHELNINIQKDATLFECFLEEVTINVTEMFRDPTFYKSIRKNIIPQLSTYPTIRIWIAGCSTGEEAYSIAVLLKEAEILHKSFIYGTDINLKVLEQAGKGIFPLKNMKSYTQNYVDSGGFYEFSDYFTIKYGQAIFKQEFKDRMVFSPHNLVTDQSFNEFNLIMCRNVLIYFDQNLQKRVISLFHNSLVSLGYLALGSKERVIETGSSKKFEVIDRKNKIWKILK